jgi:hypothetical protein
MEHVSQTVQHRSETQTCADPRGKQAATDFSPNLLARRAARARALKTEKRDKSRVGSEPVD